MQQKKKIFQRERERFSSLNNFRREIFVQTFETYKSSLIDDTALIFLNELSVLMDDGESGADYAEMDKKIYRKIKLF